MLPFNKPVNAFIRSMLNPLDIAIFELATNPDYTCYVLIDNECCKYDYSHTFHKIVKSQPMIYYAGLAIEFDSVGVFASIYLDIPSKYRSRLFTEACGQAEYKPALKILEFICKQPHINTLTVESHLWKACQDRNLQVVKILVSTGVNCGDALYDFVFNRELFDILVPTTVDNASKYGLCRMCLDKLKVVFTREVTYRCIEEVYTRAVFNGAVDIIEYLDAKINYTTVCAVFASLCNMDPPTINDCFKLTQSALCIVKLREIKQQKLLTEGLNLALNLGSGKLVKELIIMGADPRNTSYTTLQYAMRREWIFRECALYLIEQGAVLNKFSCL